MTTANGVKEHAAAVKMYTDGSCSPNPGPGGWAAVLLFTESEKLVELQGAELSATNNRMELLAALKGLQSLEECCEVEVLTDSRYLQQGISCWLARWEKNGWKTADDQAVKNRDLWQQLAEQLKRHRLRWNWIKGHAGDNWNSRADELAGAARKSLRQESEEESGDKVHLYPAVTWKKSLGAGAWATILRYRGHYRVIGGHARETTANRLYLQAVIEALQTLKRPLPVIVHTRSGYLRDGLQTWVIGWQQRNWRTREGLVIRNDDLWRELARQKKILEIRVATVSPETPPCPSQEAKEIACEFERLQKPLQTATKES